MRATRAEAQGGVRCSAHTRIHSTERAHCAQGSVGGINAASNHNLLVIQMYHDLPARSCRAPPRQSGLAKISAAQ